MEIAGNPLLIVLRKQPKEKTKIQSKKWTKLKLNKIGIRKKSFQIHSIVDRNDFIQNVQQ